MEIHTVGNILNLKGRTTFNWIFLKELLCYQDIPISASSSVWLTYDYDGIHISYSTSDHIDCSNCPLMLFITHSFFNLIIGPIP